MSQWRYLLSCGRNRWIIFSRTVASFCATTRIAVYSSTERPWSVIALTSALFPSSAIRRLSAGSAELMRC